MLSYLAQDLLADGTSRHVDGFGVPGVFDGAVGSVVGGVEWQWRQAGSEGGGWCWRRILDVVAWWLGASKEEQFVEGVVGCAKARGQRQRGRRLQGRVARRAEGHVVDVPVFEVMKRDQ